MTAIEDLIELPEEAQVTAGQRARRRPLLRGPRPTKIAVRLTQFAIAIIFLGAWELLARSGRIDPFYFSQPTLIAERILEWIREGDIFEHIRVTITQAALGLAIGAIAGILVGLPLARMPFWAAVFDPYINALNSIPRTVLAPMFLLWFGFGMASKVALVVTLVFFLVFFNAYRGAREVDPAAINNARMLGADERHLMRYVIFPSALVWILASLRVSVGFAIMGSVVGEYIGATRGIGYLIARYRGVFDTTGVVSAMVVLVVVVFVIDRIMVAIERRLLRWKPESEFLPSFS